MKFEKIPKFVINLEKRPDRLDFIKKELKYIGWDYEIFKAYDKDSYLGCTLSHIDIIKKAKENNWEHVMAIEDDCCIMPYANSFLSILEEELKNINFGILNLSPTHNRPISISKISKYLLDITNYPEKKEHHRGLFATNMMVYHESVYDEVLKILENNTMGYYPIDEFIYLNVTSHIQSYCPIVPICIQKSDFSNVTNGEYNNFYMQTYNWNGYSPYKIPQEFTSFENIMTYKEKNLKTNFIYEN